EVCLGGLITLPAAFIFLGAASQEMGTFGPGFTALPNVFANMQGGQFFGFLWFFMLFIAAITSSLSMLQPVIAFFEEGLGLKRHAAAAILGLLSVIGSGFVIFFSKDLTALDTLDFWVGTTAIFILAMVQAVMYGWIFGIERGHRELHVGAHIQVPYLVQIMLKYVTPLYLIVIFIAFCYSNVPGYVTSIMNNRVAVVSICFVIAVASFLTLLVHIAGIRWMKEGRYDFLYDGIPDEDL
ncbi:MAG: sodium:calcium symporter, partial [Planctomycetaceae bacterium]|nr:sodium:calcium symporter [Planctomycetaceae bacterium]